MAVESSEDGGVGAAGELLKRAELEAKKEREMGGDFEHIACRDGEDYDSNETEGSFVMVKSNADSDGRSDSSEREIELDVSGGVGDPPDASGAQPSVTCWGSSTLLNDDRVDEGKIEKEVGGEGRDKEVWKEETKERNSSNSVNEEKGGEMGEGRNQVKASEVMHVTREEVIVNSTRTDHELKEGDEVSGEVLANEEKQRQKEVSSSKDSKDERESVVEDLSEDEKLTVVDVSKNKEPDLLEEDVMVVEDSKGKEEKVSKVFNNEKEVITGIEEHIFDGMGSSYVQNEADIFCDGQTISVASLPITSSDSINAEHEFKSVLEEREDAESSVTQSGNKKEVTVKKEVDSAPETKEKRDANNALGKEFATSISGTGMQEVNSISDFEDKRNIDDEESEGVVFSITEPLERGFNSNYVIESNHTKDEGSKEAKSSVTDHVEQVGSASPDGVRKIDKENSGDGENESKSAIQEDESQQTICAQIDSDSVYDDLWSSAEQVQQQDVGASLAKPAREEKEVDSSIELIAQPVKEAENSITGNVEQIGSASPDRVRKIDKDKKTNCGDGENESNSAIQEDEKQQSKYPEIDSDSVHSDLWSFAEQVQQDVDVSLAMPASEEKEDDSSFELIAEPVMENIGSSSFVEQYQVVEAPTIVPSPVSINRAVNLAPRTDDKYAEVFSNINQQSENSPTDSDSVDKDFRSSVEQMQDVDTSLSKSDSEEKELDSSIESIAEPVKVKIGSSSLFEDSQVAEASSISQSPESYNRDVDLDSRAENKNVESMFTKYHQSKTLPTVSDSFSIDASMPKSDSEEKEHGSSLELVVESVKENIGASSIVEQYMVADTSSIGQSPVRVNEGFNLASLTEDKTEAMSTANQQIKDSTMDSDGINRDLVSYIEQVQQQDADACLSKPHNEEKEHDSSLELIAESVKRIIDTSFIVEQDMVAEASSTGQSPVSVDEGVKIASLAEDIPEAMSTVNQQMKNSPTESNDVGRDLMPSVEQVQQQEVDVSLSKYDSEEKECDSSNKSITDPAKENLVSSSLFEESQVAEVSSNGQSPDSVNEDANLASDIVDINLKPPVDRLQQHHIDAAFSKSDSEEKEHDSSIALTADPIIENNDSFYIVENQVAGASSISQSPKSVNNNDSLASRAEDKLMEALPIQNQQIKASPTDSDSVDRDLRSSVAMVHQQDVDASLTKSASEEKEHDSSTGLIAEPLKENIVSSAIVEKYLVGEAPSIVQSSDSFNEDANLASRLVDKDVEALSMENQQRKALPTGSDSVDRNLKSSVEQVQEEDVCASLSKSSIDEKESDSCIDKYQVVEASSFGQSSECAKENTNLSSQEEAKRVENFSVEGKLEPFKEELVSATEPEENQNDNVLSIYLNPEPKEEIGLASNVEGKQDVDVSFIDPKPEPVQMHMVSTSRVEENHDADIDLRTKPITEVVGSASKAQENYDLEAFITKGVGGRRELQSVAEVAVLEKQTGYDLKRTVNQQSDVKSVKKHGPENIVAMVNQKRELKSATGIEEPLEIHLDKDLREIKEQQMEFISEKKQDTVHIEQYQGSAAPSTSEGDREKGDLLAKKHYIIKVPRFTQRVFDNELQQKIHEAQIKVDENTRSRDSIMVELENMRKVLSDCCHKRDSAIEEEKKAKILVNAKRQEIDSLQSVISKGKIAASFLDIASQIHTLTHKMQHETISLKEEKKFVHELNQLKFEQEHHLFSKCSKPEIDEALRQKETAESNLKALKKEFDIIRSAHLKADEFAKAASKGYLNQFSKVKEHERKWRTANELRQNAYKDFHGLRSDKTDHFWKYMDDRQAARKYASSRDIDALERHCTEQIERILKLWNEDEDFRRQYVESNVNSTLKRFGTLDGKTIGVNEEAVVLPSRVPPPSSARSLVAPVKVHEEQPGNAEEVSRPALQTKKMVRSKPSFKSASIATTPAIVTVKDEIVEAALEKKLREEEVQVRLEEEHERKEDEMRKEKEAVELKEKIRMEQKAKAKEAEERKRRKSEKARARADYKSQKAAELREQKKAKKEKKKEDFPETTESMEVENSSVTEISSYETSQEPERTSKRSTRQTAVALNKYGNRVQPVPLPLRNKGKRKTSMLVWSLCGAVAVGGLVFAGNYVSFSGVSLLDFGF